MPQVPQVVVLLQGLLLSLAGRKKLGGKMGRRDGGTQGKVGEGAAGRWW